jgi:short-subunit dehydrogenase
VRVFTPIMLRQGEEGHIVNTASAAGFVSMASTAPYAVSKHSVVTLSEVLYHDLQSEKAKVGVSVLCPAWVDTNIWNSQRNRPEDLRDHAETEEERARREQVRALLEKGKVTAADIAEMTFEAIANDRFYIFPHPKIRNDIRTRMEDILELRNPTRTA